MKFNGCKFLLLQYGKDENLKENTIYFTGEMQDIITQVDQCKDLGITMQDDGSFNLQQEKSRIRETKHLSTDADSSIDTTVGWTKNTQKPKFLEKRKKSSKTQKLKNV